MVIVFVVGRVALEPPREDAHRSDALFVPTRTKAKTTLSDSRVVLDVCTHCSSSLDKSVGALPEQISVEQRV
jgi:hypothetical protein